MEAFAPRETGAGEAASRGRRRGRARAVGSLMLVATLAILVLPGLTWATCTTTQTAHCLQGKRFRVEVDWSGYVGDGGSGFTVPGATADSGLFYFTAASNWEMLIKVLNGCQQNNHYWVFGAGATSLQYTVTVTDTQTGAVRTYSNPLNVSSPAITDIVAFETCDGTAQGAQVRYYNNLFCPTNVPFTSTLSASGYDWQSLTQIPSDYQLVQQTTLGPPFTEVNDSTGCSGDTYNGSFNLTFGKAYSIAQTMDGGQRTLQLLDEGDASSVASASSASSAGPLPPLAPPKVVQQIRASD